MVNQNSNQQILPFYKKRGGKGEEKRKLEEEEVEVLIEKDQEPLPWEKGGKSE